MPTHGLFSGIFSVSPTSPPHSPSPGSDGRISHASTSSSWITSSDTSVPAHWTSAAAQPLTKSASIKSHSYGKSLTKFKIFDMLSAVDRKRKQALPALEGRDISTIQAPATACLSPTCTLGAACNSAKMQPRGATEREDHSSLRTFLESNPAKPGNKAQALIPRSEFHWEENSDGESSPQVNKPQLRSLQRMTRRWQADGSQLRPSDGLFGTGLSVDSWMETAQKFAERRRSEAQTASDRELNQSAKDDTGSGFAIGYGCFPVRTKSVLKLFDDPVWSDEDDITQNTANESCEVKEARGNDQNAVAGTSSDSTAERSYYGSGTTRTSSLFYDSPTKGEVKVDWFFGPEVSPRGFCHNNWNRYGRSVSAVTTLECSPSTARILDDELSENNPNQKSSKTSLVKRLRSQLFETTGATTSNDLEPKHMIANSRFNGFPGPLDNTAPRLNNDLNSPTRDEKQMTDMAREGVYSSICALAGARRYNSDLERSPSSRSLPITKTKVLPLRGYPKGPEDPNWDDAVRRVKKIVQEREKREAEEARQQQKQLKSQEKKLKRLRIGKDVVIRGSQLGLTPKKPLEEMTEDEFEAVGAFAETPIHEKSIAKKSGIFRNLFIKILGSTEEKEEHVEKIKLKLERHKSLELLNSASAEDLKELSVDARAHYEKALSALHGECSPCTHMPASDSRTSTLEDKDRTIGNTIKKNSSSRDAIAGDNVGFGIIARPDDRDLERTKPTRGKSYQEFVAHKQRRQNSDSQDESNECINEGLALSDIAEEDIQSHADRGNPDSNQLQLEGNHVDDDNASSWCTESIYSVDDIETMNEFDGWSIRYFEKRHEFKAESYRPDSAEDHLTPQLSEYYVPLSVQEDKMNDETTSNYSDNIDMEAMPAPLKIRVLKVKQSSSHVQPPHSNSFVPERKASFRARIHEVSRLQEAHIEGRSHPALRAVLEDDNNDEWTERSSSDVQHWDFDVDSDSKRCSLNSEFESMSDEEIEHVDEGYATGEVKQQEFVENDVAQSLNKERYRITSAQNRACSETVGDEGQTVNDVDLGALRAELGLGPLRLASSTSGLQHPYHPFGWNHEKVMCRQVHNSTNSLLAMPSLSHTESASASRMDSDYFKNSPKKSATDQFKVCQSCGVLCCHFATLVATSRLKTGGDSMEELVRSKVQKCVDVLRTSHPNGIEEYETFIACANCNECVCPKCAKRCTEKLCQVILCTDCRSQIETCPVHR